MSNKMTNDQRMIFDTAISPADRVKLVKQVLWRAFHDPDHAAVYTKLIFEYVFSKPRIGHEVAVLDMNEVFTTEVKDAVWREIMAEARERDAAEQRRRKQNGSRSSEAR